MIPARLAMGAPRRRLATAPRCYLGQGIGFGRRSARRIVSRARMTQSIMFAKAKALLLRPGPAPCPICAPMATPGKQKPGLMRRDDRPPGLAGNLQSNGTQCGFRVATQRGNYQGAHTATFPPELVRRMIVSSCDDNSVVLDVFGGAGTTAMVALQLGHRAITIDINSEYTSERHANVSPPRQRCSPQYTDDQKEGAASGRASSTAHQCARRSPMVAT